MSKYKFSKVEIDAPKLDLFDAQNSERLKKYIFNNLGSDYQVSYMGIDEVSGFEDIAGINGIGSKKLISIERVSRDGETIPNGERLRTPRIGFHAYTNDAGDVTHLGMFEMKYSPITDVNGNIIDYKWSKKQSANNTGQIAEVVAPWNRDYISVNSNGTKRANPLVLNSSDELGLSNGTGANFGRHLSSAVEELDTFGYVKYDTKKHIRDMTYTMQNIDHRRAIGITNMFQIHTGLSMNPKANDFRSDGNSSFFFRLGSDQFSDNNGDVYKSIIDNMYSIEGRTRNYLDEARYNVIANEFGSVDAYNELKALYEGHKTLGRGVVNNISNIEDKKLALTAFFNDSQVKDVMSRHFELAKVSYTDSGENIVTFGRYIQDANGLNRAVFNKGGMSIYGTNATDLILNSEIGIHRNLSADISHKIISEYNQVYNQAGFDGEKFLGSLITRGIVTHDQLFDMSKIYAGGSSFNPDLAIKSLGEQLNMRAMNGQILHTGEFLTKEKQASTGKVNALNFSTFHTMGYLNESNQRGNQAFDMYEDAQIFGYNENNMFGSQSKLSPIVSDWMFNKNMEDGIASIYTRGFIENKSVNRIFDQVDQDLGFSGRASKDLFMQNHSLVFFSNNTDIVFDDSAVINNKLKNSIAGGFSTEIEIAGNNVAVDEIRNIISRKYGRTDIDLNNEMYEADIKRLLMGYDIENLQRSDYKMTDLYVKTHSGEELIPFMNSTVIRNKDETLAIKGATNAFLDKVRFDESGNLHATFSNTVQMVGGSKMLFGVSKATVSLATNGLSVDGSEIGAVLNYQGFKRGFGASEAADIFSTMAYHTRHDQTLFEDMKSNVFGESKLLQALNLDFTMEDGRLIYIDNNLDSVGSYSRKTMSADNLPVDQIYRAFHENRNNIIGQEVRDYAWNQRMPKQVQEIMLRHNRGEITIDEANKKIQFMTDTFRVTENDYNAWFDSEIKNVVGRYEEWQTQNLGGNAWIMGENKAISGITASGSNIDYGASSGLRVLKSIAMMSEAKGMKVEEAITIGRLGDVVLNEKGMAWFANTLEDVMIEKNSPKMVQLMIGSGIMDKSDIKKGVVNFVSQSQANAMINSGKRLAPGTVIEETFNFNTWDDNYALDHLFESNKFADLTQNELRASVFGSFMPKNSTDSIGRRADFYTLTGYDDGARNVLNNLFNNDMQVSGSTRMVEDLRKQIDGAPILAYDLESFFYSSKDATNDGAQVTKIKQVAYQGYTYSNIGNGNLTEDILVKENMFIENDANIEGYKLNRNFVPVKDSSGNPVIIQMNRPTKSGAKGGTSLDVRDANSGDVYMVNEASRYYDDLASSGAKEQSSASAMVRMYDDLVKMEESTGKVPMLMGHNIESYDNKMLLNEVNYLLERGNLSDSERAKLSVFSDRLGNDYYKTADTLRTVRILGLNAGSNTLSSTTKTLLFGELDAHNAQNDIEATMKILKHIIINEGKQRVINVDEYSPLFEFLKENASKNGYTGNKIDTELVDKLKVAKRVIGTTAGGQMDDELKLSAKVSWQFMSDIYDVAQGIDNSGEYQKAVEAFNSKMVSEGKSPVLTGNMVKDLSSIVQATNMVSNMKNNEHYNLMKRFATSGELNAYVGKLFVEGDTGRIGYNGSFIAMMKAHNAINRVNSATSALENLSNITLAESSVYNYDSSKNIFGENFKFMWQEGGLDYNSLTRPERMILNRVAKENDMSAEELLSARNNIVKSITSNRTLTPEEVSSIENDAARFGEAMFSYNDYGFKNRKKSVFSEIEEASRMWYSAVRSASPNSVENMFGKGGLVQKATELKLDNSYSFAPMFETTFFRHMRNNITNNGYDIINEEIFRAIYGGDIGNKVVEDYNNLFKNGAPGVDDINKFVSGLEGLTGIQFMTEKVARNTGIITGNEDFYYKTASSFTGGNPMQFQGSLQGSRTVVFSDNFINNMSSGFLKDYWVDLNNTSDESMNSMAMIGKNLMKGANRDFDGDRLFSAFFSDEAFAKLNGISKETAEALISEGRIFSNFNYVSSNVSSWDEMRQTQAYKDAINELPKVLKGKLSRFEKGSIARKIAESEIANMDSNLKSMYNLERFNQSWTDGKVEAEMLGHKASMDAFFSKGTLDKNLLDDVNDFILGKVGYDTMKKELSSFYENASGSEKFIALRAMEALERYNKTGNSGDYDDLKTLLSGDKFAFNFYSRSYETLEKDFGKRTGISKTGLAHNYFTAKRMLSASLADSEYAGKWFDYLNVSGKNVTEQDFVDMVNFSKFYSGFENRSSYLIQDIISSKKGKAINLDEAFASIDSLGNIKGVNFSNFMKYISGLEFGNASESQKTIGQVLEGVGMFDSKFNSYDEYMGSLNMGTKEAVEHLNGLRTMLSLFGHNVSNETSADEVFRIIKYNGIKFDGDALGKYSEMAGKQSEVSAAVLGAIARMSAYNNYGGDEFIGTVSKVMGSNTDGLESMADAIDEIISDSLNAKPAMATQLRGFEKIINAVTFGKFAKNKGAAALAARNNTFFESVVGDAMSETDGKYHIENIDDFVERGVGMVEDGKIAREYLNSQFQVYYDLFDRVRKGENSEKVFERFRDFDEPIRTSSKNVAQDMAQGAANIGNKAAEATVDTARKTSDYVKKLPISKKTAAFAAATAALVGYNMYRRRDSVQIEQMYMDEGDELNIYRDIADNYEMKIHRRR